MFEKFPRMQIFFGLHDLSLSFCSENRMIFNSLYNHNKLIIRSDRLSQRENHHLEPNIPKLRNISLALRPLLSQITPVSQISPFYGTLIISRPKSNIMYSHNSLYNEILPLLYQLKKYNILYMYIVHSI